MKPTADLKHILADTEDHVLSLIADTSLASAVLALLAENDNRDIFTHTSLSAWCGLARLLHRIRDNTGLLMDDLHLINHHTTTPEPCP